MSDFSLELRPTIMKRLSDERGWSMTGALATFGSACACVSRSATTCRALKMSVPGSKIITIDDRPAIDWDRISWRNATPCSRSASRGTVTSSSTSSAERPSASVWTSTVVRRELGQHVDPGSLQLGRSDEEQDAGQADRQQPETNARADKGAHHRVIPHRSPVELGTIDATPQRRRVLTGPTTIPVESPDSAPTSLFPRLPLPILNIHQLGAHG